MNFNNAFGFPQRPNNNCGCHQVPNNNCNCNFCNQNRCVDRKSTRLNSSHTRPSRMPSSA